MRNVHKTPISRTLPRAAVGAALAEIERRGYGLPCHVTAVSGAIVTVAFDCTAQGAVLPPVTMPVVGSEYIRLPIQAGCKGRAVPSSVDLSIVTGLGPGSSLPDFSQIPANLSALAFEPLGNATWTASPNANALVAYGAGGGVILQDKLTSPNFSVTVNSSGITMTGGGHTLVVDSSGIKIDGVHFAKHGHLPGTYVAPSGGGPVTGDSGEVVGEVP